MSRAVNFPVRMGRPTRDKLLSPEQIEDVRLLYAGKDLSNLEIAERYGKSPQWPSMMAAKYRWPLRGRMWRKGMDRAVMIDTPEKVALVPRGRPRHVPRIASFALEQAKTVLRKTGRVVFNAEITDGRPGIGKVKVDNVDWTPAQVIEVARGMVP